MLQTPEVSPQQPTTVRKRDGKTTQPFVAEKIENAIRRAWQEAEGTVDDAALRRVTAMAVASLPVGETGVEVIQDAVETALMRLQRFSVAKAFIIYRQKRAEARATREAKSIEGFSPFAHTVMQARYAHATAAGKETWRGVARRVASNVMGAVGERRDLMREVRDLIAERKFMPGGRYLYAAGRDFKQTQNCLLLKAEDSREGWADHLSKVTMASMTGAGVGGVYSFLRERGAPVKRTGGVSSGPIALMQMTNETARGAGQGGSRRAALWAGLHWNHPDIHEFITVKDWNADVRAMKEKDFSAPAPMDYTNISVILDDEFFQAYHDAAHAKHGLAHDVYWKTVRSMLKSGEPGFSIDVGTNAGEHLRNAPVCAGTAVLTDTGYQDVRSLVGKTSTVWTGKRWAEGVVFQQTSDSAAIVKVTFTGGRELRCDEHHPFLVERYNGTDERRKLMSIDRVPASELQPGDVLHVSLPEVAPTPGVNVEAYTLGYVYGDGTFSGRSAEITFYTEESKACSRVVRKSAWLSSINECDGRGCVRAYLKADDRWVNRSKDTFPTELYAANPEEAVSFLAGLFDADGSWEPTQKNIRLSSKHEGFLRGCARLLEQLGILAGVSKSGHSTYGKAQTYQLVVMGDYRHRFASIVPTQRLRIDLGDYTPCRSSTIKVQAVEPDGIEPVYCADVKVEEHSFQAEGVIISNCTEITSADDSDICNLGSINMARIESLAEMRRVVEVGTAFLLAGTVYSDLPYEKVRSVREKNRRLGLGLMGIHEWLLQRGHTYGPCEDLVPYLDVYAQSTSHAHSYARRWDLSPSVKTRAIAPTGTIGIVAETTTGMEPIYAAAFKRRYFDAGIWRYQYVLDPTAKKLVGDGVDPDKIEDAYTLAESPERRVAFQAWLQQYVDHGISSTINLPAWGTPLNCEDRVQSFGEMLIQHLPKLRGITVYPDGARGGQPLSSVSYREAASQEGEVFTEALDVCDLTKGGTCGA